MYGPLSCLLLLLFALQISAGSGGFIILLPNEVDEIPLGWLSPDDLVASGGGPVGDLLWTAEDGISQGPAQRQQSRTSSGYYNFAERVFFLSISICREVVKIYQSSEEESPKISSVLL